MPNLRSLPFAAVAALAVPLACQQTLTVGPGQTFATIGAAVAAAAPGDTVLVVGGSYQEFVDIDKSLRLIGDGALLRGAFLPPAGIHVHDLGPNDPVVVRGFTLESGPGFSMPLTVERCEGPVTLHDLRNQGGQEMWGVVVTQSTQVHVAGVLMRSSSVTDSVVSFQGCVFDPSSWSPALFSTRSSVSLDLCSLHGAYVPAASAVWMDGGGALVVTRSSLLGTGTGTLGQPAILAQSGGEVILDPSASLGAGGTAPLVAGTVPVTFPFASLRATSDGAVLTASAHGPANALFVTAFSQVAPAVETPFGLTWLDLATFAPLYAGVFDATTRQHTATIPHPPAPPGATFALQTIGFDGADITLGLPTVLSMP